MHSGHHGQMEEYNGISKMGKVKDSQSIAWLVGFCAASQCPMPPVPLNCFRLFARHFLQPLAADDLNQKRQCLRYDGIGPRERCRKSVVVAERCCTFCQTMTCRFKIPQGEAFPTKKMSPAGICWGLMIHHHPSWMTDLVLIRCCMICWNFALLVPFCRAVGTAQAPLGLHELWGIFWETSKCSEPSSGQFVLDVRMSLPLRCVSMK